MRRWIAPPVIIALGLFVSSGDALSQQRQRTGTRPQSAATQRRTPQSNAARQRPVRTAQAKSPTAPIKPDAKTRAEFQKLIGASWIWSPAHAKDSVPAGDCYFRKTIVTDSELEFAQVHVACDNRYELFVNGQPAGVGETGLVERGVVGEVALGTRLTHPLGELWPHVVAQLRDLVAELPVPVKGDPERLVTVAWQKAHHNSSRSGLRVS